MDIWINEGGIAFAFPLRLAAAAMARRDGVAAAAAAGTAQVGQQYFLKAACVDSWTV